jgi:hypothetical protein
MRVKFARWRMRAWAAAAVLALATVCAGQTRSCVKVELKGDVSAGQEWRAELGEGWVFRLMPIAAGQNGYTGWDLVVDRDKPAGFPDALLLATPPYGSINQREIGTTFGLRAQDAIGWNPRSFRFLVSPAALSEGQRLFAQLGSGGASPAAARASRGLMALQRQTAAGKLEILDAHLTPGVADAAPFAESWAQHSYGTEQSDESPTHGTASPLGELHWIKFSLTLWLPAGWNAPRALGAKPAACSE